MRILNIGGAGYIGSVATAKFIKNGHKVVILDDLSTGFRQLVHPQATFYEGSMLDFKLVSRIMKKHKIDVVALYAAKIVVPESVAKPNDYYLTNVGGMATVLKAMEVNKVKKIIFASSAATFGNCEKVPVNESSPTIPCNPYGASKLMCERLLADAHKAFGINYVAYRFFNVAGAADSGRYGMMKAKPSLLIPAINDAILHHRSVKIFGNKYPTRDGTCLRDYIHVEDLASAAIKALTYLNKNKSGIFCLSSNSGYTVLEIVNAAKQYIYKKLRYTIEGNRPGDPAKLTASNAKARRTLKWKVEHDLASMIKSDYKFRQRHCK